MNPLDWQREHQVALILGAIVGVLMGLLVGFIYNGLHWPTLSPWLFESWGGFRWAVFGAVVAGVAIYVRQLLGK